MRPVLDRPYGRVRVLVADARRAVDRAPDWLTGAGAGLQAALLSLLCVVVPVLAVYVVATTEASGAGAGWLRAAGLGVQLWLLGHGVPLATSVGTVTLVPLGLSALAVFCAFASARRSGTPTRRGLAAALGGYVLAVLLVAALSLPAAERPWTVLGAALLGALLLGGAGLAAGLAVRPDAPRLAAALAPVTRRAPRALVLGTGAGAALAAGAVGTGGLVLLTWVLAGQAQVAQVVGSLHLDALSGVGLAIAELALVPNLAMWALAWLSGPGFAVGTGSHFATTGVFATPLPAVPLLGVLPSPETVTPTAMWWPLALLVLGLGAGLVLRRRLEGSGVLEHLGATAAAVLVTGLLVGLLAAASGGSAGPGTMAQVGPSGFLTGLAVAATTGLGLALVLLLGHPRVLGAARRRLAGLLRR